MSDPQQPIQQPDPIPQPAPEPAPEPAPPAPQSDSIFPAGARLAAEDITREAAEDKVLAVARRLIEKKT